MNERRDLYRRALGVPAGLREDLERFVNLVAYGDSTSAPNVIYVPAWALKFIESVAPTKPGTNE